jgi:hypothetical protein
MRATGMTGTTTGIETSGYNQHSKFGQFNPEFS